MKWPGPAVWTGTPVEGRNGDLIESLYTDFYDELLARCVAMCHDWGTAEDLVQETFLRALTHVEDVQDLSRGQCRAWLHKTAQRLYIDRVRKLARETAADQEDLERTVFQEDHTAPAAAQLIDRLPPEEKALFVLRHFEGYNASELGEIFSLPASTVRSRLASARRHLQALLSN